MSIYRFFFFFWSNKLVDGQKATGDNPIQEQRIRMNRCTKFTESKESTGS